MSQNQTDQTDNSSLSFRDLQLKIEEYKQSRDNLNKKTKEFIRSLQEIETEIVETLKIAKDVYKKKRDIWNKRVKLLKDKKIEYKDLFDKLLEERKKYHKASGKGNKRYVSIKSIDKKIEELERTIETENLEISEENEIVDEIRELTSQKHEIQSEQKSDELYRTERKIEIVKINLNKIYEQLSKWSNKSQDNHAKMLELYEKVQELRNQKKQQEEQLIENKKAADSFHEKYLEYMGQKKKRNKGKRSPGQKSRQGSRGKPRQGQKYRSNGYSRNHALLEKMKKEKLETAIEKQKAGKKLNLFEARLILENRI